MSRYLETEAGELLELEEGGLFLELDIENFVVGNTRTFAATAQMLGWVSIAMRSFDAAQGSRLLGENNDPHSWPSDQKESTFPVEMQALGWTSPSARSFAAVQRPGVLATSDSPGTWSAAQKKSWN